MKTKTLILSLIAVVIAIVILNIFLLNPSILGYNPQINPEDFTDVISNRYLSFTPGMKLIYQGETEEGIERTEVVATDEAKEVMGIKVMVVRDRVWLNNELIEDTKDWFAQDKDGNVWYFGEDSKEIVSGQIASTEGSWEAGIDGAKPGIVMEANPKIGDVYRQEYYKGEAEDMAEVISLDADINVAYGSFSGCLQTKDWTPLEKGGEEYKYYCPEISGLVYEESIEDGSGAELTSIEQDSKPPEEAPAETLKKDITEQEAIAIALRTVDGEVTDVAIEKKFGRPTYVIEIDADGEEIDVIIDIKTGEVLGTEK